MATKVLADAIMAGLASALPTDNNSDPVTGTIGRLYYATDEHRWYRDNGTSWDETKLALADLADMDFLGLAGGDLLTYDGNFTNTPRSAIHLNAWGKAQANLDLDGHTLVNVVDPSADGDAANKAYVDGLGSAVAAGFAALNLTDLDPADGDVAMGGHQITGLADPTSDQDAATKKYVDDNAGGGGGGGGGAIGSGALASLPAAGNAGDLYLPTDAPGMTYRDDGTAWQQWHQGIFLPDPPDLADFAWVNQAAATADDAHGGILLTLGGNGSYNLLVQAAPTPPYTIDALVEMQNISAHIALIWRDSASGKTTLAAWILDTGVSKWYNTNWNSPGSYAGDTNSIANAPLWYLNTLHIRMADDNTNRTLAYSVDGVNFVQSLTTPRTTFITPDQIGFGGLGTGSLRLLNWTIS